MTNDYILTMLFIAGISYVLGSLPTAYLVARLHGINIFEVGSGNMGATNVTRIFGNKWGIFVLAVDVAKAMVAIFIAQRIKPEDASMAAATSVASVAVIIGHNWSLFISILTGRIRGGKGAATAFGTLLMVAPLQIWVGMVIAGVIIITRTRYVSLAVLTMIMIAVIWMTVLIAQQHLDSEILIYAWALGLLIAWRFRDNIKRLLTGTERRLGERV